MADQPSDRKYTKDHEWARVEGDRNPERVNESPYEQGWMLVLKPDSPSELDSLLDSAAYTAFLASLAH
jgi:glycine cleavage system H lipoate-binding protein